MSYLHCAGPVRPVLVGLLLLLSTNLHGETIQATKAVTQPAPVVRLTARQQRKLIRYNEAGAIMALRTLFSAEATYQATAGNGEYGTLDELSREKLVDYVLAEGHRYGYLFRVRTEKLSVEGPASFEIVAVPRTYGRTGRRSFYIDETGVIRAADKNGAEANRADELVVIDP